MRIYERKPTKTISNYRQPSLVDDVDLIFETYNFRVSVGGVRDDIPYFATHTIGVLTQTIE